MAPRLTSAEIDDLAAGWAAKLDHRALSAEEVSALNNWLESDPRHLGAFAKARAVALHSQRAVALGASFDPKEFASPPSAPTRRRFLWGAAAAAASIMVVGTSAWRLMRGDHFSTQIGETLIVPLEDGSVVTLNTASEISVRFTRASRDISLLRGEALFDVAKDAKRPFIVEANGTSVRAVGTSFTVSLLPDKPVEVMVREGVVEIGRHGASGPPVRAAANTKAVVKHHAAVVPASVDAATISRELAWRVGRIAFEGETLNRAANVFSRYSQIRIVIDDPQIGAKTITGLFVSNDPIGFAKAAALSLDLRAEVGENVVRLSR